MAHSAGKDLIFYVKKEDTRSRYSNSHCSLCRLHLAGPCADLFQLDAMCNLLYYLIHIPFNADASTSSEACNYVDKESEVAGQPVAGPKDGSRRKYEICAQDFMSFMRCSTRRENTKYYYFQEFLKDA